MQNLMSNSNRQQLHDLPVNPDVMFSNHKNIYKKKTEKRQRKLLEKIQFLRPFLDENETILCVTTGCSPVSLFEQWLTGWIVFYLKRSLFVFTDKRIFHIPTKHDFSYRSSIAQILYGDCQSIAIKGRNLVVDYKNGKREKFICICRSEKSKINVLLREGPLDDHLSASSSRTHLCPRCTSPLIEEQYTCPGCSLEFKSRAQARKNAIIFPGGGYFYTGHPLMGLGDALAEAYLTVLVVVALAAAVSGAVGGVGVLIMFSAILVLEKAVSVYHSNHFVKEYIPKERHIAAIAGYPAAEQPVRPPAEPKPEEILSASWRG